MEGYIFFATTSLMEGYIFSLPPPLREGYVLITQNIRPYLISIITFTYIQSIDLSKFILFLVNLLKLGKSSKHNFLPIIIKVYCNLVVPGFLHDIKNRALSKLYMEYSVTHSVI